jgi:Ni2+-binding GTPase involved in maturation of urease and hydrogenase
MSKVRFLMVGGFLGAGKTTALARIARQFIDRGQSVGLVTNDQAYDLVDTQTLRAQGFDVGEVPGACFCCKFNDLVETVGALGKEHTPDVILAEPVGSCTDLVATVVEPMRQFYHDAFEVGPLTVLLKPEHGLKILKDSEGVGFSPKAAYIFLKQIEEADIVAINKIDKLDSAQRDELVRLINERFPGKSAHCVSARTGDGFESLLNAMQQPSAERTSMMAVDYDIYADGEAELGWLNCTVILSQPSGQFSLDDAVVALVRHLQDALASANAEPAHLKVMGQGVDGWAVANLVSSSGPVELSQVSGTSTANAELTVNARVATAPDQLSRIVEQQTQVIAKQFAAVYRIENMQSFRPGRPQPTHRLTADS